MTSVPQRRVLILDQLPDEMLQLILDFAMERDSPLYIDNTFKSENPNQQTVRRYRGRPILEPSTAAKDSLFTGQRQESPIHQLELQSTHRTDWIAINSTNRRIRNLGKLSFFKAKIFAMHTELPSSLQHSSFKKFSINDQALALSCMRNIVIVDGRDSRPGGFLDLPRTLIALPSLRRCTLLFGFSEMIADANTGEWIAMAYASRELVSPQLQEMMIGIGMARCLRLEEAVGRGWTWMEHRSTIERFVHPILRIKAQLLRVKGEKERSRKSLVVPRK